MAAEKIAGNDGSEPPQAPGTQKLLMGRTVYTYGPETATSQTKRNTLNGHSSLM